MSETDAQLWARRRLLKGLSASVTAGLAGCSGGDEDEPSGGTAESTDDRVRNETSSATAEPVDSGTDDSTDGGTDDETDGPAAVVRAYIQAGRNNDSDAMSRLVHPNGTATTESEETGGRGEITVESVTVLEQSDTEALVEVNFSRSYPDEDVALGSGESTTTYETRTYDGSWYVYEVVDATIEMEQSGGGTSTPG